MDKRTIILFVVSFILIIIVMQFINPPGDKEVPATGTTCAPPAAGGEPEESIYSERALRCAREVTASIAGIIASDGHGFFPALGFGVEIVSCEIPRERVAVKPACGTLSNSLVEVKWTNQGAGIMQVLLVEKNDKGEYKYRPESMKNEPYVLTRARYRNETSLIMALGKEMGHEFRDMEDSLWRVSNLNNDSVTFTWEVPGVMNVHKTLTMPETGYHVNMDLVFENLAESDNMSVNYNLQSLGGITHEMFDRYIRGVRMKSNFELESYVQPDSLRKQGGGGCAMISCQSSKRSSVDVSENPMAWAGVNNKFFCGYLWPRNDAASREIRKTTVQTIHGEDKLDFVKSKEVTVSDNGEERTIVSGKTNITTVFRRVTEVSAGETVEHDYLFYIGPKSMKEMGREVYEDARFGVLIDNDISNFPCCFLPGAGAGIAFLAKAFLWILDTIHMAIPNYGVAIIILTIFIRLLLHPISKRQQISMKSYSEKMQKMQPEIERIKKQYKNNRKKQQEEQQKLMREQGLSMLPLGGCLPMFLQLPVFVGLYRALDFSIDLRHEPFILWINDLTSPDALFIFDTPLPIIGITALNVLPLLMMAAMLVQQKISPTSTAAPSANPDQAKQQKTMMYFMLIFFAVIFYNMPSGLNLYWFTSTLLGIFESRLIKKQMQAAQAAS